MGKIMWQKIKHVVRLAGLFVKGVFDEDDKRGSHRHAKRRHTVKQEKRFREPTDIL